MSNRLNSSQLVLLHFLTAFALQVYLNIYLNTLFLSYFPVSKLVYFYIASAIFGVFFSVLLKKRIAVNNHLQQISLVLVLTAICFGFSKLHFSPWATFIFCLYLVSMANVIIVLCSNTAASLYSLRDYKLKVHQFALASSIGQMLAGFSAPLLSHYFQLPGILGVILILSGLQALWLSLLKPSSPPSQTEEPLSLSQLPHYPLALGLLGWALFMGFITVMADYIFKYQLSLHYQQTELASIFGMVSGCVSLFTLLLQSMVIKNLLTKYGLNSLGYAILAICVAGSLCYIALPSLPVAIGFICLLRIAVFSFNNPLNEIRLNPLPTAMRNVSKLLERTLAEPAGNGLAAGTILLCGLVVNAENLQWGFGMISLGCALGAIALHQLLVRQYRQTLYAAIYAKRFLFAEMNSMALQSKEVQALAKQALQQNRIELNLVGLKLLSDFNAPEIQRLLIEKLSAEDNLLKSAVIHVIEHKQLKSLAPNLLQLLAEDKLAAHTLLELLDLLLKWAPQELMLLSQDWYTKDNAFCQLNAVYLNFAQQKAKCLAILARHLQGPPELQAYAIKIIGRLKLGQFKQELTDKLYSSEHEIAKAALEACATINIHEYISHLIQAWQRRDLTKAATSILLAYSQLTVPTLLALAKNVPASRMPALAMIIAASQDEKAITQLANEPSPWLQLQIAKQCFFRALKQNYSPAVVKAIYPLLAQAAADLEYYYLLSQQEKLSYLQKELRLRQHLAKLKFLYWFGVVTEPTVMVQVLGWLGSWTESNSLSQRDRALELMESLCTDKDLKQALSIFDRINQANLSLDKLALPNDTLFRELQNMQNLPESMGEDNIFSKVLVLREVKLFEQLPIEILLEVAAKTVWQEVNKGQVIFAAGDKPNGFYMLASGGILIQNDRTIIAQLKTHDYFGEVGVFSDNPRLASAIVSEPGYLLFLDKQTFLNLVTDIPEVVYRLAQQVVGYLQTAMTK